MSSTTTPSTFVPAARFVGQSVLRKEDRRLVTGHGRYVDDVNPAGTLHLAFRRSDLARGTITRCDVSAAKALEGVVAVYLAADINDDKRETWHTMLGNANLPYETLAATDVRFVGEPIAVVVAESRYIAEDACDLIEIDFDELEPAVDYRTATGDAGPQVHPDRSNTFMAMPFTPMSPDLDEVFANAAHVVEATIESHRYNCVPMEGRGVLASWDPGTEELDVVLSTQSVHEARVYFGRFFGIPEARIRVSMRDVGGGFGQKMFMGREEIAAVSASRRLGRPVKWVEDRRENLIAAPHSRNEVGHARMAIDADGTIQAISVEHNSDIGAWPICPAVINPALLPGPYKIPRLGFSMAMTYSNTMGKAAYRGPWLFETTVREMLMDIAARQIGMDPVELRRRNVLRLEDLPFTSPSQQVFIEITPGETLDQALEILGYEQFRREQAEARAEGRLLGVGISVYVEPSSMASSTLHTEGATVRVETNGEVTAYLGTSSHGHSIETTMAQLVADHLGVDIEKVSIVQGDTNGTPYGAGTGGSRTAVIAGGATRQATEKVRDKAFAIAAHAMEAAPEDLEIADSVISVRGTPSKSMTLAEVAKIAYVDPSGLPPEIEAGLEATVRFRPNQFPTWSNATHICVVEIDAQTWIPKILRFIVSEDCGRMINPMVVEGQIYGGVVQGMGGVLLENFIYDDAGNPLTTTFMDYLLPTTTEIPDIEVGHVATDSSTNPGGFKGMGEGGAIGSHAAVANAIGDALAHLGVTVTKTPLGPNEIYELVQEAKARQAGEAPVG